MKKLLLVGLLTLAASAMAHDMPSFVDSLTVKDKVDINVVFSHPEWGALPYIKDVPGNVKKAIVFHDGQVTDVTAKAKTVDITAKSAPKAIVKEAPSAKIYNLTYDANDGLKGSGYWGFFIVADELNHPKHGKIQFTTKVIVNKDSKKSTEWSKRIAEGQVEIVPKVDPTSAWSEGIFSGQVVGVDGHGVAGAEVSFGQLNGIVENGDWKVLNPTTRDSEKTKSTVVADDHGYFHFKPNQAGQWFISTSVPVKDIKHKTSLTVEFK